jgi:hypothetical protein
MVNDRIKLFRIFLLLAASLTVTSGLHAQYRWKVVYPAKVDSKFYRATLALSCAGETCIATTVVYSPPTIPNRNVILRSTDGGLTWSEVAGDIPQWNFYGTSRRGLNFDAAQQIDSLNAVIVDGFAGGWIITTHDGWKTYKIDSTYSGTNTGGPKGVFFANVAEGMLWEPFGFFWSTVDSGRTWKRVIFADQTSNGIACQAYGGRMFRVVDDRQRIFTTKDNWSTWDTTQVSINGPLSDTSFHAFQVVLGRADTVTILGWRWDATANTHASSAIAFSVDLGATWREVELPKTNGIFYTTTDPISFEWQQHMVLSGKDSLGRILRSADRGVTWRIDTIREIDGNPVHKTFPATVTGTGRVIASVTDNNTSFGSASLAYLEEIKLAVNDADRNYQYLFIKAYPNPVHDVLNLKLHGMIVGPASTLRSRIYDVLGRTVRDISKQAQAGSNGEFSEFEADVSDLAPGVYFVSYTLGGAEYVKQFLKY